MRKRFAAIGVAVFVAGASMADTIGTGEPVSTQLSGTAANWNHDYSVRTANDFALTGRTTITHVEWWGFMYANPYQRDLSNLDGFVIQFIPDAEGVPAPGHVLDVEKEVYYLSGSTPAVTASLFGDGHWGGDTFLFSADLHEPLTLEPGVYWVAINALTFDQTSFDPYFHWMFIDTAGGSVAFDGTAPSTNPVDGVWLAQGSNEVAFSLTAAPAADWDGDGLSDFEETNLYSTNPYNPDSDNDGADDWTEVITFPCLDPWVTDTDGDTLLDGYEVNVLGTDACSADSDDDGWPDAVDPDPMNPEFTQSYMEEYTRLVAGFTADIPLADQNSEPNFTGPNDSANSGRRNSLSVRLQNAANALAEEDYTTAVDLILSVLVRVDGDDAIKDWMALDSADRMELQFFLEDLLLLLIP